jgi:hypothetical protein
MAEVSAEMWARLWAWLREVVRIVDSLAELKVLLFLLYVYMESVNPSAGFVPLRAGTASAVIEAVTSLQATGHTHSLAQHLLNKVVEYPTKADFVCTQYFRQKWQPLLGDRLAMMIVLLRNNCFYQADPNKPSKLRNEYQCKKRWLADKLQLVRTFEITRSQLLMQHPLASTFLTTLPVVDGGKRDIRFSVQMWQNGGKPLVPEDKAFIEAAGDSIDLSVFSKSLRGRQSQGADIQNQQGVRADGAEEKVEICESDVEPEQRFCESDVGQNSAFVSHIQRPSFTKNLLTKTDNLDEDYNAVAGDNDEASPTSSDVPLFLWKKRIRECDSLKQRAVILAEMYQAFTGRDTSTEVMMAAIKRAGGNQKATKVAESIERLQDADSVTDSPGFWLRQLPEIEVALTRIGIVGQNHVEIIGSDWVTSEYITGWADWYEAQDGQEKKITPGYVVRCVKNGSPVPTITPPTTETVEDGNTDALFAFVARCYEQEVGKVTPAIADQIADAVSPEGDRLRDEDAWYEAFKRAASLRKLSWAYIRKVAMGVTEDKQQAAWDAENIRRQVAKIEAGEAAEEAAKANGQAPAEEISPPPPPPTVWDEILALLKLTLSQAICNQHLHTMRLMASSVEPDGGHCEFVIGAPTEDCRAWLNSRMHFAITRAAAMVTKSHPDDVSVEFIVADDYEEQHSNPSLSLNASTSI